MSEGDTLRANRNVVASWIAGRAISRGVSPPTLAYGGFRVDVGLPDQKARYVFSEASFGVQEASKAIVEPHVFLKVCAAPDEVERRLTAGWQIRPVSFMMTADDLTQAGRILPVDDQLHGAPMPGGHVVTLATKEGAPAASGGVFYVGSTAIFDRIETHLDHRRRGLGRAVMGELGALAVRYGARRGTLVATSDGRALYETMGWRLHSLYTIAVRE